MAKKLVGEGSEGERILALEKAVNKFRVSTKVQIVEFASLMSDLTKAVSDLSLAINKLGKKGKKSHRVKVATQVGELTQEIKKPAKERKVHVSSSSSDSETEHGNEEVESNNAGENKKTSDSEENKKTSENEKTAAMVAGWTAKPQTEDNKGGDESDSEEGYDSKGAPSVHNFNKVWLRAVAICLEGAILAWFLAAEAQKLECKVLIWGLSNDWLKAHRERWKVTKSMCILTEP